MSKGKVQISYLGRDGLISSIDAPDYDFLYETSTVKDARWNIGDTVILPDRREFVYAKNLGTYALHNSHGCSFSYTGYTAYTAFAVAAAVGDKQVTVPAATHAALTVDELRGGYIVIFDGASDYYTTTRQIIGNDAAAANATFVVYLDAPLTYAITVATSACEVYQNPYAALTRATDTLAKAGVPATYVSAAAKYFWVQVKGICFVSPYSGLGNATNQHGGFWRHDGNMAAAALSLTATIPAGYSGQYGGYVVEGSQTGNGPLFCLQG